VLIQLVVQQTALVQVMDHVEVGLHLRDCPARVFEDVMPNVLHPMRERGVPIHWTCRHETEVVTKPTPELFGKHVLEMVCMMLDPAPLVVERECRMAVEELHKLAPYGLVGVVRAGGDHVKTLSLLTQSIPD
jgi:hypothetical protein